jgi:hypothetical protein
MKKHRKYSCVCSVYLKCGGVHRRELIESSLSKIRKSQKELVEREKHRAENIIFETIIRHSYTPIESKGKWFNFGENTNAYFYENVVKDHYEKQTVE